MDEKKTFGLIVGAAIAIALVMTFVAQMSTGMSIDKLEGQGYVVFAAGEYDELLTLMEEIDTKADAAVANAEAAASYANETLVVLRLHTENEALLFPAVTNVSVTLTAPATPNTWGTWTEIVASDAVTFSSKFTDSGGYISQLTAYEYSVADKLVIIKIAYDDDGTDVVGRAFLRSDWTYVLEFNSEPIPEDVTVYYRMMSNQADETIKVNFRYYYN